MLPGRGQAAQIAGGLSRPGFLPLRQIIAERLRPRGIAASAEDIVTTAGLSKPLDIVCRALVCKRIATENPTYELGKLLFGMNHVETIGLPLDPFTGINVMCGKVSWRHSGQPWCI